MLFQSIVPKSIFQQKKRMIRHIRVTPQPLVPTSAHYCHDRTWKLKGRHGSEQMLRDLHLALATGRGLRHWEVSWSQINPSYTVIHFLQQDHKYPNKASPANIATPFVDHFFPNQHTLHPLWYKGSLGVVDFCVLAESMGTILIFKKNIRFINYSQILHLNTYHETSIILVSRTLISFQILVAREQILNLNTFHSAPLILVYHTVISFHILVDHGPRQR